MKKILFLLLFLLFILIVNCVYQKTYALYVIQTTQEKKSVATIEKKLLSTKKREPKIIQQDEPQKKLIEPTAKVYTKAVNIQTMSKNTTLHKKEILQSSKTISEEKNIAMPAKREKPKKTSLTSKAEHPVATILTTTKKKEKKKEIIHPQKVNSHTPEIDKKEMKTIEHEAVDYLLLVLKEHKNVLKERDEAELKLHQLIERVLKERKKAIESMEKIATSSAKAQNRRIEARDKISQSLPNNHSQGE
jgi:Txe/YoeB family toxin of Txe-Axe toxin-antitoxin module